jgi:DNA-binding MarR family transcriptional regulator
MDKNLVKFHDDYTTFRLLCELEGAAVISQRELARRLNAALGLVNAYLKVAAGKGWIKVKLLSANRTSYHLTSKGLAERSRLALQQTRYLDQLVAVVREAYQPFFSQLRDEGVERVALCGIDGFAETVWLLLREAGIDVSVVMDTQAVGSRFMGREVISLAHAMLSGIHRVVISSRNNADTLYHALLDLGVDPSAIKAPALFLEKKYAA